MIVTDKPNAPTGPLTASDINGDELTLKWNPPKDDGGEDVNNYIVEKRVEGTNKWVKVSSFLTSPRCVVRNLDPGTKYEFRVMAENSLGVSDALETDEAILAKLPFGKKHFKTGPISATLLLLENLDLISENKGNSEIEL